MDRLIEYYVENKSVFDAIFDFTQVASFIGAFIVAILGYLEYRSSNKLRNLQTFLDLESRYWSNPTFRQIIACLDDGTDESAETLQHIPLEDKIMFLAYYEKIILMADSGVLRRDVVNYFFGYYAMAAWKNDDFWTPPALTRDDPYWGRYKTFCDDFERRENSWINPRKKLKI